MHIQLHIVYGTEVIPVSVVMAGRRYVGNLSQSPPIPNFESCETN